MKKEIYITILLFALMLFVLAVTVVRGRSFDADQTQINRLQAIIKCIKYKGIQFLPGGVNMSTLIPCLKRSNNK